MLQIYHSKNNPISGTDYREVKKKALLAYKQIIGHSKRRPYVRSLYFNKDKVFLELFWKHLSDKNYWDQMRRMKFFTCGIEVIQKSHCPPLSKDNPNKTNETLHRFRGITPNHQFFCVQIKEYKRTGKKFLISIFQIEE